MTATPSSAEADDVVHRAARQLLAELEPIETRAAQGGDRGRLQAHVFAAMDQCLETLRGVGLVGRANRVPSSVLWNAAGGLLTHGKLQWRARFKPRGYAGDDVMLQQIFDGWTCDHPLGQLFDAYFQSQDAPEAVRGRILHAGRRIAEHWAQHAGGAYHLVSVGSGPAIEIELALRDGEDLQNVRATLFDLDHEALDAASERLAPLLPAERLACVRENLFRLSARPRKARAMAGADFVVCLGLLDYLEDVDAVAMLQLFWSHLRSGGMLLVGNFAPRTQARAYMEWIGNWYLIYRTSDELAALAQAAGISSECFTIGADPTGVDLMLHARRGR
jgi:hypothetical protein